MFSRYSQIMSRAVLGGVLVTTFILPGLAQASEQSDSIFHASTQKGFSSITWSPAKQQVDDEPPLVSGVQQPLERLVELLAEDEPPLSSRATGFCPISPGLLGETDQIWSDRPLFIWRGEAERLVILNFSTLEPAWEQPVEPGDRAVQIPDGILEPGQLYQWEISNATNRSDPYLFRILAPERRAEITADLITLETQLKTNGATEEAIAAERAYYFAQLGLWSDAMQQLQAVESPSTEIAQTLQMMADYICTPPQPENDTVPSP